MPGGPVAIGAIAHDTAQISGATATAGGTVTYKLYSDDTCTTEIDDLTPAVNTVVNGIAPDSDTHPFTGAGTFYFWVEYSGDSLNVGPVNSGCAAEPYTVSPNAPAPHSLPVVEIKDTFSVGTFAAPASVVPLVVGLYSDATCMTLVGRTSFTVPAAGGTVADATSFVAAVAGSYYFKISYAGDANNTGFSSCAESVGVTITSIP